MGLFLISLYAKPEVSDVFVRLVTAGMEVSTGEGQNL